MKRNVLFLILLLSMGANAQLTWNFISGMEGWHDLGTGRDVAASWENGKLKMTYIDGGNPGTNLWFPAIQTDNLNFNAADYKYLQINYETTNWPTLSPVKMLLTLTKTDNSVVYSYVDIDPAKNFLSFDIQANNPGWGAVYEGTIKTVQLELPHNAAAASDPATAWYTATTKIDRIQFVNYRTTVWDFKTSTEGWGSYGGDLALSNAGDGNLSVSFSSPVDGTLDYTTIYTDVQIDVSNTDLFYMKYTALNWPLSSALINIHYELGGNHYYSTQTLDASGSEIQFNIRSQTQHVWSVLPATGTTTRIRIELPHSSGLTGYDWSQATLKIDKIVFSKINDITEVVVSSDKNISSFVKGSETEILVNSESLLTINENTSIKSIVATPNAKIKLETGATLTISSGITLQSDASGTATLVDNTTNAPQAVTATVQQYVEAGRNWYMSIPLASGASSLLNRGASVVCFDEPSGNWVAPAENTLLKMRGYIQVATPAQGTTGTVYFTGVVNTGAQSINLTRTEGKSGFNLVGNPYPSYLDWNAVTKTNVSNTMWYRTKEGSVYKFYTYVANEGAGVGSPATVTNKIPPMQAFWVRVNTVGTGSIAVDNTMRSHKDVSGNILKAPAQAAQQLLRLQVSNGTNTDETVLYFNANASDEFDTYDAQKRSHGEPGVPEIFTKAGTEQLVINGLKQLVYNTEIPIGFSTAQANNFSITANEFSNFEEGTRIILIDKQNPAVETDLTKGGVYNFSAPVTTATTERFSVLFRASGATTAIDSSASAKSTVIVNASNQMVVESSEPVGVTVYNLMGRKLYDNQLNSPKTTLQPIFESGVYFVSFTVSGQKSVIQKVIIR